MIVIADTTPLNHLILIDRASILEVLYRRVIVPSAVLSELQAQAPHQRSRPGLVIGPIGWRLTRGYSSPTRASRILTRENATRLAWPKTSERTSSLMDGLGGRQEAARRNLQIAGTLTVLYLQPAGG
jgi:predicted nucleic acid-binding protein